MNSIIESFSFFQKKQYPPGFSKNEKRGLRRASERFPTKQGLLYYTAKGQSTRRQVSLSGQEQQRILESCHSSTEGKFCNLVLIHYIRSRYSTFALKTMLHADVPTKSLDLKC